MEELISCDVCMEVYDEDLRCPRMLACGHTFCSSCIQKVLLVAKNCPVCKALIDKDSMESIAVNYSLKRLTEEYLHKSSDSMMCSLITVKGNEETEGVCELHLLPNQFGCMTCRVWICGTCATSSHRKCRTRLVKEAVREMNEERNKKIQMNAEKASSSKAAVSLLLHHYQQELKVENEELRCLQELVEKAKTKISYINQNIEKVENMDKILTSLNQYFEIELRITKHASCSKDLIELDEDLNSHIAALQEVAQNMDSHKFYEMTQKKESANISLNKQRLKEISLKENVYVAMKEDEVTRWGYIDVRDDILRVYCLQKHPPPPASVCLMPDQCFMTFNGDEKWPRKFFLKLASWGDILGEVVITLNETAKETAKAILLTCLGSRGLHSFKSVPLDERISLVRPCSSFSLPIDVDQKQVEMEVKNKKEWKEGEVAVQLWSGNLGMKFGLNIFVEEKEQEWKWIPAGQVESGIEVCKYAYERMNAGEEVEIMDCGLFVDLNN